MPQPKPLRTEERQAVLERIRSERRFWGPVGWLLDRQLLVNLKAILRYTTAGEHIDPRNWMVGRNVKMSDAPEGGELWFDYLSDSGDGMKATYSVASLAYADLWTSEGAEPGDPVSFDRHEQGCRLPRGAFLFVGGDTTYQVADYATLGSRFQLPFSWAFHDLRFDGRVAPTDDRRPIFGIPGNHDYYDFLDGFNRQFRRPFNSERVFKPEETGPQPMLVLDGFRRRQWASYLSIELPFGWHFLGLDAQGGKIDRRQQHFFSKVLHDPEKDSAKLILATPEPITAFGRRCGPDSEIVRTLAGLGLPQPFLHEDPSGQMEAGTCRLDLAGDVHHYTRYWGVDAGSSHPAAYASVVSGLGGAFLHSTSTDRGKIAAKRVYPPRGDALAATVERLLTPWNLARGGRVWAIGILIALTLFLAATTAESLRTTVEILFNPSAMPELAQEETGPRPDPLLKALGALRQSLRVERLVADPTDETLAYPAVRAGAGLWHRELAFLPVLLTLALFGVWWNHHLRRRFARIGEPKSPWSYRWPVWLLTAAGAFTALWVYIPGSFLGLRGSAYKAFHPLTSNGLVLILVGVSYLGFLWSRQYDEAMTRQARIRALSLGDQANYGLLWIVSLLTLLFGLTR